MPLVEPNEEFLEGLYQHLKQRVQGMATQLSPDTEVTKKLNQDEISTLWNTRGMPLDAEWEMWRQLQPDGTPRFTPEQIGLAVFPHREGLAKRGGRIEPREQARWVNSRAQWETAKREAEAAGLPPLAQGVENDSFNPPQTA